MLDVVLDVWLLGVTISAVCSLIALLAGGFSLTAAYSHRDKRSAARVILGALVSVPLAPLWPVLAIVGGGWVVNSLLKIAEIPTLGERLEARQHRRTAEAELAKRERLATIARLEREELNV